MSTTAVTYDKSDPIIDRLEDQIGWYGDKSSKCQKYFKRIKLTEIVAAALIPFLAAVRVSDSYAQVHVAIGLLIALLGVTITILEGVLQLNQYQRIWVTYRATSEALKHEKFTYLAKAGAYATAADDQSRLGLLAERMEAIMSQENSKWLSLLQQPLKVQGAESPSQQVQ